jgi:DNA-binding NarL/FixJ family response regulator
MDRIRVAIIDDDLQTRNMLRTLIESRSHEYECEGVYDTAEFAIKQIPVICPNVVLVDIHLPGGISGIDCVQKLKIVCPETEFIMCTSLEDSENIFAALQAGATGYITKSSDSNELLDAIKIAYNGGAPMSGQVARKVLSHFYTPEKNKNVGEKEKLSLREQEILEYLAQGMRYKEIAGKLQVSVETVRKHIHNIYEKLQVSSRTDALNKAYYNRRPGT